MHSSPARYQEALPMGHPCEGCEARGEAACGVLDGGELKAFRNLGWNVNLKAGQTLFHEGDPASRVFTLTRGMIKLYKLFADGRCHVTGFLHRGDFLGITVDDHHAFSAEAIEDAQLCSFPRNLFDDFVANHSGMERELYHKAEHELAAAQQQMVLLGRKTAVERVASFLLLAATQARRETSSTTTIVHLPMLRSDIADYLGLTKETVSRMLSQLIQSRLIRLKKQDTVEIRDWAALERCAG